MISKHLLKFCEPGKRIFCGNIRMSWDNVIFIAFLVIVLAQSIILSLLIFGQYKNLGSGLLVKQTKFPDDDLEWTEMTDTESPDLANITDFHFLELGDAHSYFLDKDNDLKENWLFLIFTESYSI
ncbi:hypothetical protein GWI33_019625 [Rhynchophorus ferrugineus]|uniref:Uncharacterized protein n=1 Tax=Rhynchophorus ferrugineus TaxID=354439 RepID=A0A834I513_RHYFE|nr:hypothetical protein GWI33_019625 [Rhynchophorus ferrugineus]